MLLRHPFGCFNLRGTVQLYISHNNSSSARMQHPAETFTIAELRHPAACIIISRAAQAVSCVNPGHRVGSFCHLAEVLDLVFPQERVRKVFFFFFSSAHDMSRG